MAPNTVMMRIPLLVQADEAHVSIGCIVDIVANEHLEARGASFVVARTTSSKRSFDACIMWSEMIRNGRQIISGYRVAGTSRSHLHSSLGFQAITPSAPGSKGHVPLTVVDLLISSVYEAEKVTLPVIALNSSPPMLTSTPKVLDLLMP